MTRKDRNSKPGEIGKVSPIAGSASGRDGESLERASDARSEIGGLRTGDMAGTEASSQARARASDPGTYRGVRSAGELSPARNIPEELTPRGYSSAAAADALRSDLEAACLELTKTQREAQEVLSRVETQLKNIRKGERSLTSDPGRTEHRAGMTGIERQADLIARVDDLESDLAAAREELARVRNEAERTKSDLIWELRNLRTEKESLVSDLARARQSADRARIAAMESALAEVRDNLERRVREARGEQPPSGLGPSSHPEVLETYREGGDTSLHRSERISVPPRGAEAPEARAGNYQPGEAREEAWEARSGPGGTDVQELSEVSLKDVGKAVFAGGGGERMTFAKSLSDFRNKDVAVRVDAARAMGAISHELSVRAIAAQFPLEGSPQVRQELIKALANLGMEEGIGVVEGALGDEAPSVRLVAVWGLYQLAGARSAPALISMLSDENEGVRRRAAMCIGWLNQTEFAVELLPLLEDVSESVRRAAAEAMGSLRDQRVVFALIERLRDPDESVRRTVLTAIENITGKKMSKSLPRDEESLKRLIIRWNDWCSSE